MFYSSRRDGFLRFGDIVKGFISAPPTIKRPVFDISHVKSFCNIDVEVPPFSVILTPCCSIGDHMLCLTPLIQLRKTFFNNSYFVKDLTIINREIKPEYCYPPEEWEAFDPSRKDEINAMSKPYTLLNLFIYEKHDLLPLYPIAGTETNYYMIDFRNVSTVKCDLVKRAEQMGIDESAIIESKLLQLSDTSREELRNKLAYYYGRIPEEELPERIRK